MEDVSNRDKVTYHAPSPDGIQRHAELSLMFEQMLNEMDNIVPAGRERSLAKTKLEEAKFWASAGVARNPETR